MVALSVSSVRVVLMRLCVRGLLQRVSASCERQEAIIVAVQEGHEQLVSSSGTAEGQRESKLKMVAASYDVFMEITDNLREGTKFYNDLTQLLVTFQVGQKSVEAAILHSWMI